MSIKTRVYRVTVPSELVYRVEADSEEDAVAKVAAALFGPPPTYELSVALLADRTTQKPPPWDVEEAAACALCGEAREAGCFCTHDT